MVEEGVAGGICHSNYRHAKASKLWYNKESSYFQYWYINKINDWAMSQKFPVNDFVRIESSSQFNANYFC